MSGESPLAGVRIVLSRPDDGSGGDPLAQRLQAVGAVPLHLPLIRILPPDDLAPLREAVREIRGYDWVVLTSPRALPPLLDALQLAGIDGATLGEAGVRFCAVGPATAQALRETGISVDLVPPHFHAEGVVEAILAENRSGSGVKVLFPRAEGGREVIPRELAAAGLDVVTVSAYRTLSLPEMAARLVAEVRGGTVDAITFSSGSAARTFAEAWARGEAGVEYSRTEKVERVNDWPMQVGIVALGRSTAAALREGGLPVHSMAEVHTLEGLIAALEQWARHRQYLSHS